MSSHSFAKRYRDSLLGTRSSASRPPVERVRTGYSLWHRYWTSLLGIRLRKPATDNSPDPGNGPVASTTAGSQHSASATGSVSHMSPSRAAQEAVQRHAWANKTTGWLPRLGELDDPVRLGVHRAVEIDTSEADNP